MFFFLFVFFGPSHPNSKEGGKTTSVSTCWRRVYDIGTESLSCLNEVLQCCCSVHEMTF